MHADSQHTPSTHAPEEHCVPLVHVVPLAFWQMPLEAPAAVPAQNSPVPHAATEQQTLVVPSPAVQKVPVAQSASRSQTVPSPPVVLQLPDLQVYPVVQSAGVVQSALHVVAPQVYGAHGVGVAVPQPPAPLQRASLDATSPVQLAAAQTASAPGKALHAVRSDPSHLPLQVPVPEHAARTTPCGLPTTAMQVPSLPPTSHASH